jgi:hypothetical protein
MLPPLNVQTQTLNVNGRSYSAAPGATLDVPDFDSGQLAANGWTKVAMSGPTSARPSINPNVSSPTIAARGAHYFDSTLGYVVVFDGATWRNPSSGAGV